MQELWSCWQQAARVLGGRVTVSHEPHGAPRLAVVLDGVDLEAGITATGLTWLGADVIGAGDWRCAVSPNRRFPLAGTFTIRVGDRDFDSHRVVRTSDAPLARAWLDERARMLLLAADGYHFVIQRGQARGFTLEPVGSAEQLITAAWALAVLAGRGHQLGRQWRDLAARLGVMVSGGVAPATSLRVPLGSAIVTVDAFAGGLARRRAGRGLFVRVRCPRTGGRADGFALRDRDGGRAFLPSVTATGQRCAAGHAGIDARYGVWADDPQRLTDELAGAADLLAEARPELLVGDVNAVTLFFLGVDVAPARVRAGVELAGRLALDQDSTALAGPYR